MKKITTIILAAGKSTRFISSKSKVFHDLAGKPIIDYVFSIAKKISKNDIVIVCNKKNINDFRKNYKNIKFSIQNKLNGTAGAVISAKKHIKKTNDVLILCADVPLVKIKSIKKLINQYRFSKSSGSMIAFNTLNPFGYGRVETKGNKVIRVTEETNASKSVKNISLCNSGIMLCNYDFLFLNITSISNKNIKKEKFLTDLFEKAENKNKHFKFSMCSEEELQGINTLEDLLKAEMTIHKNALKSLIKKGVRFIKPDSISLSFDTVIGKDSVIEPFVVIKKGVKIGKNVIIKSHSVLENCIIGDESSIGPSARIRPNTKIGKKVKIGNYVEIKNSVIGESSSISHLSYIGDANLGKKVNVGAGTITCNYDGKNKHRTNIRDNVFIGSNASLVAPLTINNNSIIGAGSVVTKNIPKNSLVIERSPLKIIKKLEKGLKRLKK